MLQSGCFSQVVLCGAMELAVSVTYLDGGVLNLLQGHPQKFIIIFTAKKSSLLTKHHFCSKYNIWLHPAPASQSALLTRVVGGGGVCSDISKCML